MELLRELRKFRKPLYGISLMIGVVGIVLSWILLFIFYGAIDTVENTMKDQLDAAVATFTEVEETVVSVANELETTNETITSFQAAVIDTEGAMDTAGDAALGLGNGLNSIDLGVISLASYAEPFLSAGQQLKSSADSLNDVAISLDEHKTNLAGVSIQIGEISASLNSQKGALVTLKETMTGLFSTIKLALLLMIILVDSTFAILGINSIAGLLSE